MQGEQAASATTMITMMRRATTAGGVRFVGEKSKHINNVRCNEQLVKAGFIIKGVPKEIIQGYWVNTCCKKCHHKIMRIIQTPSSIRDKLTFLKWFGNHYKNICQSFNINPRPSSQFLEVQGESHLKCKFLQFDLPTVMTKLENVASRVVLYFIVSDWPIQRLDFSSSNWLGKAVKQRDTQFQTTQIDDERNDSFATMLRSWEC